MRFLVDGKLIGTVVDTGPSTGAFGVAAQDAEVVRFDDFYAEGPEVKGNADDVAKPELSSMTRNGDQVTFQFSAVSSYDYFVQVSPTPSGHDWQILTNFRAKLAAKAVALTGPRIRDGFTGSRKCRATVDRREHRGITNCKFCESGFCTVSTSLIVGV